MEVLEMLISASLFPLNEELIKFFQKYNELTHSLIIIQPSCALLGS